MRRDAIYTALTAQLAELINKPPYNVQVVSRGFVDWVMAHQQPAIYVVPMRENAVYKLGFPVLYTLSVDLYVYVRWTDSLEQGGRDLAVIMDGIEYMIGPGGPNGGVNPCIGLKNTLGGLVNYCALSGPAEISLGFLSQSQAIARMPVEIQTPQ